ncbi:MAG: hypothetical protein MJ060_02810 [Clostridia bacterium]|nr:hypothetical protein [Clostridia bacterium]
MIEEIINKEIENYEEDELYYLRLFDKETGTSATYYGNMANEQRAKVKALKELKIKLKERGLL